MIAVIRIKGQVKTKAEISEALLRMSLPRKFSCIILDEKNEVKMGMLKKVAEFVAFGKIDAKILEEMKPRSKGKFYALHPPRGGLKSSKRLFPKGVLGNHHDKIGELIRRML